MKAQLGSKVTLKVVDMANTETDDLENYDVAIDKGTLDAILMCSSDQRSMKREAYVNKVHRHINKYLLLVSCNWTRNELLGFFQPSIPIFGL